MFAGRQSHSRLAGSTVLLATLVLLTLLVLSPAAARAMEFRDGDGAMVAAGTIVDDDLIATGESVVIAGRVTGDVYAFGRSVVVTGQIDRDLISAAQQVTVDGVIGGNLRTAGQQVVVNGRVEGNTTAAGQFVTLSHQGSLGGSFLGAAQDLALQGPVARGATVGAATLALDSPIGGDVQAAVSRVSFGPAAQIAGRLEYTSEQPASIPAGAVAGSVRYTVPQSAQRERVARERQEPEGASGGSPFGIFGLAWLLGSMIAGVLLVHFFPRFASETTAQLSAHPWASFGFGTLTLFAAPVLLLFIAITIVGLPLSMLGGLAYLVALYLGWLLFGLAAGGLLLRLAQRGGAHWSLRAEWLVVLGLVALYLVTHLPVIGWLIGFVALCLGLGALEREVLALRRTAPAAAISTA